MFRNKIYFITADLLYNNSDDSNQCVVSENTEFRVKTTTFCNIILFWKNFVRETFSERTCPEAKKCFETTDLLRYNSDLLNQCVVSEKPSFFVKPIFFRTIILFRKVSIELHVLDPVLKFDQTRLNVLGNFDWRTERRLLPAESASDPPSSDLKKSWR
jgi:hypothetical protein